MKKFKRSLSNFLMLFVLLAVAMFVCSKPVEADTQGYYKYYVKSDGTAAITEYTADEVNCVIPQKLGGHTVTAIEYGAFAKKEFMQTVQIPSTVKTIEYQAFIKCTALKSLTIPNSVTEIGSLMCQSCTSLESVVIGTGVKEINAGTFSFCSKLKSVTLPYGLEVIGGDTGYYGSFAKCTSLTSINIPSTVTKIDECAFSESGLTSVTIPDSVVTMEYNAFGECKSLQNVIIGSGVKTIPNNCFAYCSSLNSVAIRGNTLEKIDSYAFNGTGITSITMPSSVDSINNNVFAKCTNLSSVKLNEGLGHIGEYVFSGCTALPEITIPSSVVEIGNSNFNGCSALKTVYLNANVSHGDSYIIGPTKGGTTVYCYSNSQYLKNLKSNASSYGYTVSVMDAVPSTSVTLTAAKSEVYVGDRLQLSYRLSPSNTTDSVEFISSDKTIATVNQHGIVKGKARGSVIITARTNTGNLAQISIQVKQHPKTLSFNRYYLSLKAGETKYCPAVVDGGVSVDVPITYTSSNSSVAKIDSYGNIRAVSAGVTNITATVYNGLKATLTVTVTATPVKKVSFSITKKTMAINQTAVIKALVDNGARKDVAVQYKSSNTKVLTVASNGKVKAKRAGVAYITATAGGKSAKVKITVKKAPSRIKFTKKSVKVKRGKSAKLKYSLTKNSYTYKLTWKSSNKKIATVNSKGIITGKKKGTCKIVVKTHNGKKAAIKISVQ